jgi:hypothetical protein
MTEYRLRTWAVLSHGIPHRATDITAMLLLEALAGPPEMAMT